MEAPADLGADDSTTTAGGVLFGFTVGVLTLVVYVCYDISQYTEGIFQVGTFPFRTMIPLFNDAHACKLVKASHIRARPSFSAVDS